jgi:NB-ARC domain
MNVTAVLQLMESLLHKHDGKEFEDLHKEIVTGLLQYKTYREIAEGMNYDPEYVGTVSRELYEVLSKELKALGKDEEVKKSNFTRSIEKIANSYNQNFLQSPINNSHVSLCLNNTHNYLQDFINESKSVNECYHDLKLAPKIINFYQRETDLTKLDNAVFAQNTPLISVLGLSGIGKTTLVKRFVDLNLDKFEVIIWKNLKYPKSLTLLINDFLTVCKLEPKETLDEKLTQLFDILTEKKCLIILDDVQNIFISGELAGKYKPEYQDYQNFFTMITETNHQSNVILISQESCPEMQCLDEDLYPIKCLELSGLYDVEILKNTGLTDEEHWLNLIKLYQGDIFYLKSIIMLINTNYDSQVAEFLAENTLHITNQMQSHFQAIFNHLSPIEQELVLQLSKFEQPIFREDLRQSLNLSSVDFNNGLQSLQQRYLITKIKEEKILFKLSPVFQEYVRNLGQ